MNSADKASHGDIAIIGMACLFPGADGPEAFWRNICAKSDQICEPAAGWGAERHLNGLGPTRITTASGGFLGDLYRFDPAELGVMPSSVDGNEPDQFLALKAARDALADAGYLDGHDHTATGIVLGHSPYLHRGNASALQHGVVVDQFVTLLRDLLPEAPDGALSRLRAALLDQLPPFNADITPGLVPNLMTGRITNKLDMRGPNFLIDAACASSLIAVQTAMEELRAGRSDLMLAGAVNASITATAYMVFTQLGALSRRAKVRPFDADTDGTLLGEGLGVVVLKRLDDAIADGDRIYAVIKAVAQASDGRGAGLFAPRLDGEVLAIRRAFADTDVSPATIGLIEAHGTGIPLGDRTEIEALREVFGERLAGGPRVALGSVKSMIGHCIPAAGMAGLIKSALALHYRTLPPTLCDEPRADLRLETTPFYLNTESRPWVSPRGTKRHAGINAFGFGGINSHAILEEAPERGQDSRPAYLPVELVVVAAATPSALAERVAQLKAALAGPLAEAPLPAIAAAAVRRDGAAGPARLAVVATSRYELADKLGKAHKRLSGGRGNFQVRSGIYAVESAHEGKLAFVFPGEGAQYQGMLADVLIAFPEARRWFDFWDGLFASSRRFSPSDCVFPAPTTLSSDVAKRLESDLFGLEMGSEAAFIGCQALLAVARRLGLEPDAVVGHSSGEHAALCAAGVLGGEGWESLGGQIRELNRLYREMAAVDGLPAGGLLAVGALPRERVLAFADGESVHLALDNCYQQTVLYGSRGRLEEIAHELGREGGLCAFLPFDRPYHTPLFAPVAAILARVYEDMRFAAAKVPIYSCATAAPMPAVPDDIRRLAAEQWCSRVRFTETIERMYADGFRVFVEVGSSANLTGFVENVLQGRSALAVSLDSRRRSSLVQLLHAVGRLWVAGQHLNLATLFADRQVPLVDLDATTAPRSRARVFSNLLPFVRLPEAECTAFRKALGPAIDTPPSPLHRNTPNHAPAMNGLAAGATMQPAPPEFRLADDGEAAAAVSNHFALMRRFLDVQGAVMTATLPAELAGAAEQPYPFLHRIVSHETDRLVAECDVDLDRDEFIRQHVLCCAHVSDLDPDLTGLPVVPLAASLEMMAEAASELTGRLRPIRLEQVRLLNWIALDDGRRALRLEARLLSGSGSADEVRVAVGIADEGGQLLLEAEIVLADSSPAASGAPAPPLAAPRPAVWKDEELYTTGMFHGPMYHSVASLLAFDDGGIDALLADTPLQGFFVPDMAPSFLFNPILLDAIGHVSAFWLAEHLGTNFSCFPSAIERIDLFAAQRQDTAGSIVAARMSFETGEKDGRFLKSDFTCTDANGQMLLRATGWRDRLFHVLHRFFFTRWMPRDGFYGDDVSALFAALPEEALVWSVPAFSPGFLDEAGGIWRRVIAHTVLSREERGQWATLPGQRRRRDEWLMGRIALKEAARVWIERRHGIRLYPADLVLRTTEAGKPYLAGWGLDEFGALPELSVAHVDGEAAAAAAPPGVPVGVDLEETKRVNVADLLTSGFSDAERATLFAAGCDASRVVQAWCAKEAAAKCIGTGLDGRPQSFIVSAIDECGHAQVETVDAVVNVALASRGSAVLAVACAAGRPCR
jgi:acyl transferase domain-containing protein/phosphopantetheinyl transferase